MATEKRLIDANALLDAIEGTYWYHISPKGYLERGANSQIHRPLFKADDIFQALKDAPIVDAVEVVHGQWIKRPDERICPFCNDRYSYFGGKEKNFCPNCGAKMDGGTTDV